MYSHHHIAFRFVKFVLGQLKLWRSRMKIRLDCFNYMQVKVNFNPLNAELNLICYLLALLGAHHFLHVSRIRVNMSAHCSGRKQVKG